MQNVNPLIEQRGLWGTFHRHLIVELFEWLLDRLGDAYWVDMESEVLLIPRLNGPGRSVSPDVEVTRLNPLYDGSGTATLTPSPAVLEVDETLDEVEQYAIQVRRRDWLDSFDPFGSRIVSVIELLSPFNKGVFGAADRRKFLAKRRDYLSSPVSYTEIDLLQAGERDLPQAVEQLEDHPYMVWASQPQHKTRHHWGWGWDTADPLPVIGIPLEYPHVHILDLGYCYGRAFERNRWPLRLTG